MKKTITFILLITSLFSFAQERADSLPTVISPTVPDLYKHEIGVSAGYFPFLAFALTYIGGSLNVEY